MSNNVEPIDDFKLNAQRQAGAEARQAIGEASPPLTVDHERTKPLKGQNQVGNASVSWGINRLLHTDFGVLFRVRGMFSSILRSVKSSIVGLLSLFLARLIGFALARPMLKSWALALLCRYPSLEARLCKFAAASGIIFSCTTVQISSDVPYGPSTEFSRLAPSVRGIYADLKAAIKRYHKEG